MKHARWIGALAGAGLGVLDTYLATSAGIGFAIGGRDVSRGVLLFLSSSFGVFGFLVGYLLELRRRELHAADLIRRQLETIRDAQQRLAQNEKLASLGQLASAIAHEMRNPLAVIRSTVQNLEETVPPEAEEASRTCRFVLEEIDRLSRVTSTLLDFSRPLQVVPAPVEVAELLGRVRLLSDPIFEPQGIELRSDDVSGVPPLEVDLDLTCQVLLGLLANAAAVSVRGSQVRIEARETGGRIEIAVCDSGPGVPDELRERIFEPFYTTRPEGTGLGLAVARQIVEAHGGEIAVSNNAGGGACFAVRLPAARARSAA